MPAAIPASAGQAEEPLLDDDGEMRISVQHIEGFGPMTVYDLQDAEYKALTPGSMPVLDHYAQQIAGFVTITNSHELPRLSSEQDRTIQAIGREINAKHGFRGMQYVWKTVQALKGPGATSDLTRMWDGIGQWQK